MSSRGFSLLELLIAITLTSIIFTVIYSSLFTSVRAKKYTEALRDLDRSAEGLFRRWMIELKGAVAYTSGGPRVGMLGISGKEEVRRDQLQFLTASPPVYNLAEASPSYVHEVGYYPLEDDEGVIWLARREETGTDLNLQSGGKVRKIIPNLSLFQVEYYSGEEWLPEWQQQNLPIAVRIEIGFNKKMPNLMRGGEELEFSEHRYRTVISLPRRASMR